MEERSGRIATPFRLIDSPARFNAGAQHEARETSRELAESIRKMAINWTLRLRQREAILLR
ncbi:MAG: hypothetical protein RJB22_2204 [Pseudomonadota bacterium]